MLKFGSVCGMRRLTGVVFHAAYRGKTETVLSVFPGSMIAPAGMECTADLPAPDPAVIDVATDVEEEEEDDAVVGDEFSGVVDGTGNVVTAQFAP